MLQFMGSQRVGRDLVTEQQQDPDAGKDWQQKEKRVTEDEMVGWHHRLNGHKFEQTLGDTEGQGSLVCWSPGGHRVRHDLATEQTSKCHRGFSASTLLTFQAR